MRQLRNNGERQMTIFDELSPEDPDGSNVRRKLKVVA